MVGSERRKVNRSSRRGALAACRRLPAAYSLRARGFTLLELMIVISILVILALIAMAQYNKTVLAAKEATLREDLYTMRKMIDQYAADKGKLPQSLQDLKSAGYIHEVPIDPFTEQADWYEEPGEDPGSTSGEQGLVNVRSNAEGTGSDGTPYKEW
jgi:general secretion pathway protein G